MTNIKNSTYSKTLIMNEKEEAFAIEKLTQKQPKTQRAQHKYTRQCKGRKKK